MRRPIGLLLVGLLFAGCLDSPPSEVGGAPWWEQALPSGDGHDHRDLSQHEGLSTGQFEVVARDPLPSAHYGAPSGGTFCGDVQEGAGRRLAAVETRTDVAVAFSDVTDPAAPRWIGELVMPRTHIYDVAVVPDGRHAVLVSSQTRNTVPATPGPGPLSGPLPSVPVDRSPLVWETCDESTVLHEDLPLPAHMFLVDVLAQGGPRIVHQQPLVGYGHSVLSRTIDGIPWVVVSSAHFRTQTPVDAAVGSTSTVGGTFFFHLEKDASGPRLTLQSVHKPGPDEEPAPTMESLAPRAHDAWLQVHPKTGQTLAYLAGGDRFTVVDVSDPRQPLEIARWSDSVPGREGYSGSLHSAFSLEELWDGRHYTVLGPEFANHPVDHPSGIVWVLDTTDPTAPHAVAGWTLPHEVEWDGTYQFSNHYFAVMGDTLLVSMYHGGVWAVDLSPVRGATGFRSLPSDGVFLPDVRPDPAPVERHRWSPTLQEVVPIGGDLFVTFDGDTGLYVVRYTPDVTTDPAPAWPITAPR